MSTSNQAVKELWDESFDEAIALQAYNTAPVEAVIRTVSYYFRDRFAVEDLKKLHFLEMGCGAGPNLMWLAQKGIKISGVDISPTALRLARMNLEKAGYTERVGDLIESSVTDVPFADESFDGIVEACVFQHLTKEDRVKTFGEVKRLLKPGGVFVGYMLDAGHTVFQAKQAEQLADDAGTLVLNDGSSKIHLTNIGVSHFYRREEYFDLLEGFSTIDPCLTAYYLTRDEAQKRGYPEYLQSMWTVYAIK
jgi:ubiquinone/menaquinone biosynthesis C-methylase UbiE